MSEAPDDRSIPDGEVPDAVLRWISSKAAERNVSEIDLLQTLLEGQVGSGEEVESSAASVEELHRVEREFRALVEDVRERIVQVKRETDEKAPSEHTHAELSNNLMQLGREVGSLEAKLEQLDNRLTAGFENYEEILTYLTESNDDLDRKLGRLASALIELRGQVGAAAREENRRNALTTLTDTANRHGVKKANCETCGEDVHIGMLVEPQCPHCDTMFSGLEPKTGFFRNSILHSGARPALESGDEDVETELETLETLVENAETDDGPEPSFETEDQATGPDERAEESESTPGSDKAMPTNTVEGADAELSESKANSTDGEGGTSAEPASSKAPETDGQYRLERIDGVGPAYANRLEEAGIDDLLELAAANPEEIGEAINIPETDVADWIAQADAMTGT